VHHVSILVLNSNFISSHSCHIVVLGLGKELSTCEFGGLPQRGTLANYLGSLCARSAATNSCAEDVRRVLDELLGNFGGALSLTCFGKIGDVQGHASSSVAVSHDVDHLVTLFVHFDTGEVDLHAGELLHLVLDLEALWRSSRVVIATITDVFSMAWGVKDVEDLLDRVRGPLHVKSLVKATLDVFREVTASISAYFCNERFNCIEIFREVH